MPANDKKTEASEDAPEAPEAPEAAGGTAEERIKALAENVDHQFDNLEKYVRKIGVASFLEELQSLKLEAQEVLPVDADALNLAAGTAQRQLQVVAGMQRLLDDYYGS